MASAVATTPGGSGPRSAAGTAGLTTDATIGADPTGETSPPESEAGAGVRASVWWTDMRTGVWISVARVVAGVLVGHMVLVLFPGVLLRSKLGTLGSGTWLGAFDRWDAGYYTRIAAHGYPAHVPDVRAFFPGYPLVIRVVHELTGGVLSYAQTGCLVSMAALVVAAGLLHRLVAARFGGRAALVSTALFCWCPASAFFLAPYSESLFALTILAAATMLDRGRWWWAVVIAGYATATSPEGLVLTGALVVAALVARRRLLRILGYGVVGSFGILAYMLYLGVRFGEPFGFAQIQSNFHRVMVPPFVGLVQNLGSIHHVLTLPGLTGNFLPNLTFRALWANVASMWVIDDIALLLALGALVALTVAALRPVRGGDEATGTGVPMAWTVLLGGIVLLASMTVIRPPGGNVSTEAVTRMVGVAFPLYPGLYLMVRRWQVPIVIGLSLSVAAAMVIQVLFNFGYWAT